MRFTYRGFPFGSRRSAVEEPGDQMHSGFVVTVPESSSLKTMKRYPRGTVSGARMMPKMQIQGQWIRTGEGRDYLRSLLYSMSNHIPKNRVCRPLIAAKTRAMALMSGMSFLTLQM